MEIKNQNNLNQGDVYNIEKIDTVQNVSHQDINPYLVEEKVISGDVVDSCKVESVIVLLSGIVGFCIDILNLFSWFDFSWWLWLAGVISAFLYIVIKYEDAFFVSRNESVQVSEIGKILTPIGNDFSKKRSEAPCIYPNCKGVILPVNTPLEYEGPYNLMGKCSVSDLQHGYVIDNNLQAYKADIYNEFNKSDE